MQRIYLLASVLALLSCELPYAPGVGDTSAQLERRRGLISSIRETLVSEDSLVRVSDVELVSTTGLTFLARIRTPVGAAVSLPGVVLIGGRDTGRDAVRLVAPEQRAVIIAPDYSDVLRTNGRDGLIESIGDLRDAALDMAAGLQLLGAYLARRPEVDTARIALIGVSYGGFFAPVAAASDTRFRNIGMLYSAGDLQLVLEENIDKDLPTALRRLGGELAVLPLQRLEPLRYVGDLAPRPLLIVNGLYDHRIPRRSAESLLKAAREPKELVWLPTGHLEPTDSALIRELVDTAFARMPVLAGSRAR